MNIQHSESDDRGVFFIRGDRGIISELTYEKVSNDKIVIDHTETKIPEEGKGLASKLVAETVDYARANNLKVYPLCPFAEVQFDQHKEYSDVRVNE